MQLQRGQQHVGKEHEVMEGDRVEGKIVLEVMLNIPGRIDQIGIDDGQKKDGSGQAAGNARDQTCMLAAIKGDRGEGEQHQRAEVQGDENGITFLADENNVRMQFTLPHVAYLKISDGCNNRCSYCAIPSLRGELRSRTVAGIVAEAKQLIANGVKELVVIAQDLTAFGQDRPERCENAAKLLRALDAIEGDFVLRLLYTHPAHYTDEFIDTVANGVHILPYLDMPLQHISDRILKAMNRHIDRAGIENLLTRLRERIPGLTLRTTFITGLPGETEAEFEELCEFAKKWKFDRFGVFSFAPEPGTPAAEMAGQIPAEIADERAGILLKKQRDRMRRRQQKLIGSAVRAIFDYVDEESGYGVARTMADAPDIDNVVYFEPDDTVAPGDFITLEITGCSGSDLTGTVIG